MDRKLECILQDPTALTVQGKDEGFLDDVGDANKLGGLLEDIRDAIMEYQVCISLNWFCCNI